MDNKVREEFEEWFKEKAKSPIDPWHKSFAWEVWQACAAHKASEGRQGIDTELFAVRLRGDVFGIIKRKLTDISKTEAIVRAAIGGLLEAEATNTLANGEQARAGGVDNGELINRAKNYLAMYVLEGDNDTRMSLIRDLLKALEETGRGL